MDPGKGILDFGIVGDITDAAKRVGGFADYSHRFSDSVAAFARGDVGYDNVAGVYGSAIGGMRIRF